MENINNFQGLNAVAEVDYDDLIYDAIKGRGTKLYLLPMVTDVIGFSLFNRLGILFRKLRDENLGHNQEFDADLAALIYCIDRIKCYY